MKPHLRIVPFLPGEGVYSYYLRLCEKDKAIGYPWCAQAFAGFTLADLRRHYTTMMKKAGSKVRVWTAPEGKTPVAREEFIAVPKLFPQQAQLVHALENNGIRVYIVTASPEEIVRFLACAPACDPLFTLDLPPERIIGINVLLRDDRTGDVTSSRMRLNRSSALFDVENTRDKWEQRCMTSFVLPPVTMYAGKVAGITSFIHPAQEPVLAAGDSGSDFPMLFYCAGARVWVEHTYTRSGTFEHAMEMYQNAPEPSRGWVHGTWDMDTK